MKIQNKLLFTISMISILIVVFQLWSAIPDISEYADGRKWMYTWNPDTDVSGWVVMYDPQASTLLLETSIELILNVCFFSLVAFWSFSESLEKEKQNLAKPETTN